MEFLVIWLAGGVIAGLIASKRKNRSFGKWCFYGFMIPIVAIIHALLIDYNGKQCPECLKFIPDEARKCHYCGSDYKPHRAPAAAFSGVNPALNPAASLPEIYCLGCNQIIDAGRQNCSSCGRSREGGW